jgi:hypothetical protein
MKNLEKRKYFKNRHTHGLPKKKCLMTILVHEMEKEHFYICEWTPLNKKDYLPDTMPSEGYLGTARVVAGKYKGIGFHAWMQNDYEFIWYSLEKEKRGPNE